MSPSWRRGRCHFHGQCCTRSNCEPDHVTPLLKTHRCFLWGEARRLHTDCGPGALSHIPPGDPAAATLTSACLQALALASASVRSTSCSSLLDQSCSPFWVQLEISPPLSSFPLPSVLLEEMKPSCPWLGQSHGSLPSPDTLFSERDSEKVISASPAFCRSLAHRYVSNVYIAKIHNLHKGIVSVLLFAFSDAVSREHSI